MGCPRSAALHLDPVPGLAASAGGTGHRAGAALAIIASVPAYLAAGIARLLGAGWGSAAQILVGTGILCVLALAAVVARRGGWTASP